MEGHATRERGAPLRILVVDDEPSLRMLLRRMLEMEGFDVIASDDGLRGLAAAQQQRPDAIVLDLMMPVMDGYQVLAHLRRDERTAEVPVVVLTASATLTTKERVLEAGASVCLTKPFVPDDLCEAITSAIASHAITSPDLSQLAGAHEET